MGPDYNTRAMWDRRLACHSFITGGRLCHGITGETPMPRESQITDGIAGFVDRTLHVLFRFVGFHFYFDASWLTTKTHPSLRVRENSKQHNEQKYER